MWLYTVCFDVYTYVHVYVCIYTHMYVHTYVNMYVYMYTYHIDSNYGPSVYFFPATFYPGL